jgi:hypothetical protein
MPGVHNMTVGEGVSGRWPGQTQVTQRRDAEDAQFYEARPG